MNWDTGENRAWRTSRAELGESQNLIRSCRRSWNNRVASRAKLGDGDSRASWQCNYLWSTCRAEICRGYGKHIDESESNASRAKLGDDGRWHN